MTIFKKCLSISLCIVLLLSVPVFADKSSVEIDAPAEVAKGETVTITIKVRHDGNNFLHYTDWVSLQAGGKEIARWDYSMFDTPEDEMFTRKVEYTVTDSVVIQAEANCNIHGSAGKRSLDIAVK